MLKSYRSNYRRKWYYSPSAIIGLEKGIPTVVGVEQATKEIKMIC